MLGRELGVGHAAAGGVDRLRQGLGPRPVLQQPPDLAQRAHDLGLPGVAHLQDGAQSVGRQGRPARGAEPAAEQQDVHVAAAPFLQVEAGLGHALAGVEFQREIPERMGQEIRHLALPFGGRRGTRRRATWLARLSTSAPSMSNRTSGSDWTPRRSRPSSKALRSEHRDLDEVIDRLIEKPPFDQLQLQRLKKRKLGLKDQILKLESQLIPDIIA